jgi:tetratricopeptide (TPR) repeat protein
VAVAWWQSEQAGARRETELRRRLQDEQRWAADRARLGRNAEAVAALLGQCEQALKAGDAAKAAVALDAARKRSAEGGADEQGQRLGRLAADLALLRELDGIDQFDWTVVDNKLPNPAAVAARTRAALRRFGADPDAVAADEAVARVSASVVRERVVPALDRLLRQEKSAGARAVLRLVDADEYRDAVRDAVLGDDWAKFAELAGRQAALDQPPGFAAFLGESGAIGVERRRRLLEAAVGRRPGELGLLMTLGRTYLINQEAGANERLRWFQAAVAAAPANAAALNNLGLALDGKGQLDEAIACYRKAIALDPNYATAHSNLGVALAGKGQLDEAIACYKKAIALDPKNAVNHTNLGAALAGKGQLDEAIACFKKAIALDPKVARAHHNLGATLADKGQLDAAIASYNKAIELDPKLANAHYNLGNALARKGKVDEAIACYRKRIELDPTDANDHNTLFVLPLAALAVWFGRDADHAAACDRALALARGTKNPVTAERTAKVCSLRPGQKARHDAALALARKAVEVGKDHPYRVSFRLALGMAEYRSGLFAQAAKTLELGPPREHVGGTAAFYRAMSLFRQGKKGEAEKLAREAAANMRPLPKDEKSPLADNANADDLILWLAYREAKALIGLDAPPRREKN